VNLECPEPLNVLAPTEVDDSSWVVALREAAEPPTVRWHRHHGSLTVCWCCLGDGSPVECNQVEYAVWNPQHTGCPAWVQLPFDVIEKDILFVAGDRATGPVYPLTKPQDQIPTEPRPWCEFLRQVRSLPDTWVPEIRVPETYSRELAAEQLQERRAEFKRARQRAHDDAAREGEACVSWPSQCRWPSTVRAAETRLFARLLAQEEQRKRGPRLPCTVGKLKRCSLCNEAAEETRGKTSIFWNVLCSDCRNMCRVPSELHARLQSHYGFMSSVSSFGKQHLSSWETAPEYSFHHR